MDEVVQDGSATDLTFWVEVPPPVLKTISAAGSAGSYSAGTWAQNFRDVPGYPLLSSQSNWNVSPAGTPAFEVESGS